MKPRLAIDFDAHAAATYSANFPGVEVRSGKVEGQIGTLPAADVVIGGPPCQGFSLAGDGLGEFDPRNGWPAALAAVQKVMPRMFLFENVAGMLTKKHIVYLRKVFTAFERLGYRVEMQRLDSVNFGVAQSRDRIWIWGIRNDLTARHCWPAPTHAWPWPEPGMFGDHGLQRAVTVGWALNIPHRQVDGVWFEGSGISGIRRIRGSGVERRDHELGEPCPTAMAPTGGKSGLTMVMHEQIAKNMGAKLGGRYDHGEADAYAPCPTIKAGGNVDASGHQGGACPPAIHEYRWSDAMLTKHPPASPASTVQAKYAKGGAEGLVEIVDDPKHRPHQPGNSLTGGSAKAHGMNAASGYLAIDTKQKRTTAPVTAPVTALGIDSRHSLVEAEPCESLCGSSREPIQNWKAKKWVRRLTPAECSRLMSMPDDFKWPDKISKTAMYRIIGNGQCSLMAHHMAQALAKADPASETVISLFCGGGVGDVGFHGRYWEWH